MNLVKNAYENFEKILDIDPTVFPPPMRKMFEWVQTTYGIYQEIRTSVMNLYNVCQRSLQLSITEMCDFVRTLIWPLPLLFPRQLAPFQKVS